MSFLRCLLAAACIAAVSSVIVEVPGYATVRGSQGRTSYTKRPYYSFVGLHYAKKPTNLTRFLPPVPVDPFPVNETIDGDSLRHACSQAGIIGTEDCLFVSVHSPKLPVNASDPNTKLLPVMFWIHGGSFNMGGDFLYIPRRYMEEDIILVEVQYRLGPLGFLTLNTDEAPGNAGLFDQIEGLRWVKKFIKYFGGDPDCVTIVGESAGSASVSLLLLAPQARGLFHRAIGESGSVLAEWALDRDPKVAEQPCRRVAELAGCPLEPYSDLIHCLRNIPARKIVKAYKAFVKEDRYNGGLGFGCSNPTVQIAGTERLIEKDPREIMESGNYATDIPIMFGANKQEGTLVLTIVYQSFLKPHNYQNNSEFLKHDIVPTLVQTLKIPDDTGAVADALKSKYLSKTQLGNFTSMVPGLIDMTGVTFIKSAGYENVVLHSKHNPNSYWYSFDYEGRYSLYFYMYFGHWPPYPHGVSHADELIYLFEFLFPLNANEKLLSQRMLKVWTTFAKYGNPTPDDVPMEGIPKFQPYDSENEYFMSIDRDWTIKQDYTKEYTVTVDSQTSGKVETGNNEPVVRGTRHTMKNSL